MSSFTSWINATKKIAFDSERCVCPNCGHRGLKVQFVGDREMMIGHAYVWCRQCLEGIHVSRVEIPQGVRMLPMNVTQEELMKYVPRYHVVS